MILSASSNLVSIHTKSGLLPAALHISLTFGLVPCINKTYVEIEREANDF